MLNLTLNPQVFRTLNGCQAEIVVAIWARTDPSTGIAPNLSLRQIDADVGWGHAANVQRHLKHIIRSGYLEKRVNEHGVNEFRWTKAALCVQAPIRVREGQISLSSPPTDALSEARAHALSDLSAPALSGARAHALSDLSAPALSGARAPHAADPYGNSASLQKQNSPAASAGPRHRLIDDLRAAAEAAGIGGCCAEERADALALLREVGIDGRQCHHIADLVPLGYIRANVSHVRKALRDPRGGAYFKAICQDWAAWFARKRGGAAASPAADQLSELTDAEFARLAHEAIEALHDVAAREQARAAVREHGTPRTSRGLCDLVRAYLDCRGVTNAAA